MQLHAEPGSVNHEAIEDGIEAVKQKLNAIKTENIFNCESALQITSKAHIHFKIEE